MSQSHQPIADSKLTSDPKGAIHVSYRSNVDLPNHSLQGLARLFEELEKQGVRAEETLAGTGIAKRDLCDPELQISDRQRIRIFGNVHAMSKDPLIGLKVGMRQRLSDFGIYGYAVSSSATFGKAIEFGIKHIRLAGPVLEKNFRVEGSVAIFEGHDVLTLSSLLPLVTEFWFASMQALIEKVLEKPFRAERLLLPYPAPAYASYYREIFRCPVEFEAGKMQWIFDASLLSHPLPNANIITADMCAKFCQRLIESLPESESKLVQAVRLTLLHNRGNFPSAELMANRQHMSVRTLHRRLASANTSYQEILDEVRHRLAKEYLRDTKMSIEEIADRTGFADASNFRKAYRKWTGLSPREFREQASSSAPNTI